MAGLVGGLKALEGDVLASLQLDRVLNSASPSKKGRRGEERWHSPVNDGHSAIFLPLTNIPGTEPPVSWEDDKIRVQIVP